MIVGQRVQDQTGRPLIIFDPEKQPYKVLFADRENFEVIEYSKDLDPTSPANK